MSKSERWTRLLGSLLNYINVYRRDLFSSITELVSSTPDHKQGNYDSCRYGPDPEGNELARVALISDNGRYVYFVSQASDLVPGVADPDIRLVDGEPPIKSADIFRRDMQAQQTAFVTVNYAGTASATQGREGGHLNADNHALLDITPDGRYVLFWSTSTQLVRNPTSQLYVRDMDSGTTVSLPISGYSAPSRAWLAPDGLSVFYGNRRYRRDVNQTTALDAGGATIIDCDRGRDRFLMWKTVGSTTATQQHTVYLKKFDGVTIKTFGPFGNITATNATRQLDGFKISGDGNHVLFSANRSFDVGSLVPGVQDINDSFDILHL